LWTCFGANDDLRLVIQRQKHGVLWRAKLDQHIFQLPHLVLKTSVLKSEQIEQACCPHALLAPRVGQPDHDGSFLRGSAALDCEPTDT
jgi:hypothetical protein